MVVGDDTDLVRAVGEGGVVAAHDVARRALLRAVPLAVAVCDEVHGAKVSIVGRPWCAARTRSAVIPEKLLARDTRGAVDRNLETGEVLRAQVPKGSQRFSRTRASIRVGTIIVGNSRVVGNSTRNRNESCAHQDMCVCVWQCASGPVTWSAQS